MKIVHICDGWTPQNGAANIARLIADEQAAGGAKVVLRRWVSIRELRAADEVWVHCGWKPCLWWAALWGRRVKWVPECCYDPIRLNYHGWKKRLAGPIERFCLRRCAALVATCPAEADWIRAYLGTRCPKVEVEDIKRFFNLGGDGGERNARADRADERSLHVLYLGRRHPLKGVAYLEQAVQAANEELGRARMTLRCVSDHRGEELERDWAWCDVLCLPTLSDNFGLVVAEALTRGKRVVTTDGAPAWETPKAGEGKAPSWCARISYLQGYRAGSDEKRVTLLKGALLNI